MLAHLKRRWQRQAFGLRILQALSPAFPLTAAFCYFTGASAGWGLAIGALCLAGWLLFTREWTLSTTEVARYLDKSVPALQESTTLLLAPPQPDNTLAALQAQKIGAILENLPVLPRPYRSSFIRAWGGLAAALLATLLISYLPRSGVQPFGKRPAPSPAGSSASSKTPTLFYPVLTIRPPAYTGRASRRQTQWDIQAEQEASLRWSIRSSMPVSQLSLRFGDTTFLVLRAADSTHTKWEGEKVMRHPGFYQLACGDTLSGFHKMDMIPDLFPVIRIPSPNAYTVIDFGEPGQVSVHVQLSDDYGIGAADIHLTSATGNGEAVRFKEEDRRFSQSFSSHSTAYDLHETIDLEALGLHPGDDLYFYVRAKDTRGQESRSSRYIVSLPDTAQLMSLEGLASAANVKPEFLRSERQIIIETEALLKDQTILDLNTFHQKSNDLGVDQKLLRLRYGQFLGEESESDPGKDASAAGGGDQSSGVNEFGNADKIIEAFTDKHDNAEDATFFDPATKEKLKATLSEMWKAEGRLRTYQPREALPFAYKALRLLKELQQQSRVYVAKTGAKTAPLKVEKRLTGDLGAIINPVHHTDIPPPPGDEDRKAFGVLEQLKAGGSLPAGAYAALEPVQGMLIRAAAGAPNLYLNALEALGRVRDGLRSGGSIYPEDILSVEGALHHLLPTPPFRPGKGAHGGVPSLSASYFNHLNQPRP